MGDSEYNFADPDVIISTPPREEGPISSPPRPYIVEISSNSKGAKKKQKTDPRNQKTLLSYAKPGLMTITDKEENTKEKPSNFDEDEFDFIVSDDPDEERGIPADEGPKKLVRRLISETDDEKSNAKAGEEEEETLIDQTDELDFDDESDDDKTKCPFISHSAKDSEDEPTDEEVEFPEPKKTETKKEKPKKEKRRKEVSSPESPPPSPPHKKKKNEGHAKKSNGTDQTPQKFDVFMKIKVVAHYIDKNGKAMQLEDDFTQWYFKQTEYPDRSAFITKCQEYIEKRLKDKTDTHEKSDKKDKTDKTKQSLKDSKRKNTIRYGNIEETFYSVGKIQFNK